MYYLDGVEESRKEGHFLEPGRAVAAFIDLLPGMYNLVLQLHSIENQCCSPFWPYFLQDSFCWGSLVIYIPVHDMIVLVSLYSFWAKQSKRRKN